MKKWIALCLCGLMAASLAGCGDSSNLGTAQLGEYKGVSVLVQSTEVTDEEVEEEIQKNLDDNPDFVEVDRPAEEGDTVSVTSIVTTETGTLAIALIARIVSTTDRKSVV